MEEKDKIGRKMGERKIKERETHERIKKDILFQSGKVYNE